VTPSVPWERARTLAYQVALPKPPQLIELSAAIGCVLADDLLAGCDLPPADTSAMDGWAVSGPPPWHVVGWALAGRGSDHPRLARGQAVVIATGSALPAGVTGIVRSEQGRFDGDDLWLAPGASSPPDLADVRRRGHEASAGELLIPAGTVVRPTTAGLAAAAGHDVLPVRPRPRVALLVLGDELLDAGPPREGSVRDALGVQLPGWVQALGGEPGQVERVADDATATLAAIRDGASTGVGAGGRSDAVDVIVTTGGSARGAADHLRSTLRRLDARIVVDTVDVRPGHPMLLAELPDGRRLVGLPGNPLAALAGVLTLLAPLLAGLSGAALPGLWTTVVEQDVSVQPRGRRLRAKLMIPVVRTVGGGVRPTGHSASAMLRGVALADGFLLVPPGGIQAGEQGTVVWFPWTPATGRPLLVLPTDPPTDIPLPVPTHS
jgi:molybdopterin molybdotransferase